jgi:uncharacterized SAM-binding protein YcdF (DUF218 family)
MILKSKYVFESKGTRMYRHFLSAVIILVSIFLCYTFVCAILLLDARNEGKNSKATFVQSPPDLIVVFTGGQGRIEYAVKSAQEFRQPNVFITGVHQNNSVKTIMNPIASDPAESTDHIELDYTARNTVENVVSTLKYLRNNRGLNKILVVSSDYHIMRIKMIFETLIKEDEKFEIFFSPVPSNYLSLRSIKILYTEVFKLARTKLFLIYWDETSPIGNFY